MHAFKTILDELRKTLTYDQGKKMSEHQQFTVDTGIPAFFAQPTSPWERGTNKNTDDRIRQSFPKGTDFAQISEDEITRVQRRLSD